MKNSVSTILRHAKAMAQQKSFDEALSLIEQILHEDPKNESAQVLKVQIGVHSKNSEIMESALKSLVGIAPINLQYSITLAQLYLDNDEARRAPEVFESLLTQFQHPDLYFNYAWFLTRAAEYKKALINYQKAIDLGLQGSEEVHLNMANIYSSWLFSPDLAKKHLMMALKIKPNYIDALYNLGNLEEDSGNREGAKKQFQKIRDLNPYHGKASARLAMATNKGDTSTLISELEMLTQHSAVSIDARIDCHYALGKLYDQHQDYDAAFNSWLSANKINQKTVGKFDRSAFRDRIDSLIKTYSPLWHEKFEHKNSVEPLFIGGMFRSGSTLLEQMLAAHPQIEAGGELDYFPRTAKKIDADNPPKSGHSKHLLESIAEEYTQTLSKISSSGSKVTDKRPDNALHIGLIKSVFPKARVILTRRELMDNCLSIYSHRFGRDMNYACDLEDISFYANELNRLTEHWISLFGTTIHIVDYDDLVKNPERVITGTLNFLGLSWDDSCLEFHRLRNVVSTASVWQVRQPLHCNSSGRWVNYSSKLISIHS